MRRREFREEMRIEMMAASENAKIRLPEWIGQADSWNRQRLPQLRGRG
jgi:hypothetical protein